ncbi:helix-turn-helix domain-containing protein [Chitinophaga sp.]|uniref:helix-turn-helix domain-containing protein n=1 Tax=Chitinophaga sp. TaxID=1869181 RepID=UPI00260D7B55|nr:helix-turn-helix domain-containing protein [uncultured Chitinophaga sp.]
MQTFQPGLIFQYFVVAGLINTAIAAAVLVRRRRSAPFLLLLALMVLVSFQALLNAFDHRDFFLAFPHLSRVSWLNLSLVGPLVYLFTCKMTGDGPRFRQADLLHAIPFALALAVLLPWFFQSAETKRRLLMDFDGLSRLDFGWMNQANLLLITAYLLAACRRLRQWGKTLPEQPLAVQGLRWKWLRAFLGSLLVILGISALGFFGRKWNIPGITHFYHYNYAAIVVLVYWLIWKCQAVPELFTEDEKNATKKYRKSGLAAPEPWYERLCRLMEERQPFLDPDLTHASLADLLGVQRHHLSQIINEHSGGSYFEFVNGYRIEAVKRMLADPRKQHLSILGIAMECGFQSKATFNAAFRKMTGVTPSEWQKAGKMKYEPMGAVDGARYGS